jgi:transposase
VRRSYKFLLRPTVKQQVALAGMVEDHRQLYNAALEHRKAAYQRAGVTVRYGEQSADLKHIRRADPDGQGRWSFSFAHKTARKLVRDHDLIAHEALRIANMTRSARGTLQAPGSNVAAKAGLNRSILDAGWGVFLNVLRAKAESAGRAIVEVDARHTSQRCTQCGHTAAENRVSQAIFRCQACRHTAHADQNAAENIRRAGLALQAARSAT